VEQLKDDNMTEYDKAINLMLSFKKNFQNLDIKNDKKEKVPKKLISELGEFYVFRELGKRFKDIELKGGQGKFDIRVGKNRIEVKTSTLKFDRLYNKQIEFWGWTVKKARKNDKQKIDEQRFDFLVGVALYESWENPEFYVFTFEEAYTKNFDVYVEQYPSIQKKIHIFKNEQDLLNAIEFSHNKVTNQECHINRNKSKFLNQWAKIQEN
jgi:hypothetical protein